jgi:hypothetical protein
MAVAKCRRCRATVSVRLEAGAWLTGCGDSFRTRCAQRTDAGTVAAPGDCAPMREAIARAQLRAEREAASVASASPPAPLPA